MPPPPPASYILLLDIDNTLYRYADTGFGADMHRNIFGFIMHHYHLTEEEAADFAMRYYHNYGVSLLGFFMHFQEMNAKAYSDFVHNTLDYKHRVAVNEPLRAMLHHMAAPPSASASTNKNRYELCYFTNANRRHAIQCLRHLDILSLFVKEEDDTNDFKEYDVTYAELQRAHKKHNGEEASEGGAKLEDVAMKQQIVSPSSTTAPTLTTVTNNAKAEKEEINNNNNNNKKKKESEAGKASGDDDDDQLVTRLCAKQNYDGYSYEDQWRLTEPHLQNKPYRAAYEAVCADIQERLKARIAKRKENNNNDNNNNSETKAKEEEAEAEETPQHLIMVDDSLMNLKEPLLLGWKAVWLADKPKEENDNENRFGKDKELYETALNENRFKIIYSILDLEKTCEAF